MVGLFIGGLVYIKTVAAAVEGPTRDELKAVYNYHPHLLPMEEVKKRSYTLDALWKKAEADEDSYIQLLRTELQKPDHVPFFYFDAGSLLMHLSDASSDKKLFLSSLRHVDFRDIQNTAYLRTVHKLALDGYDTSDAAFNILKYPEFEAYAPIHSLTIGQEYSLMLMLFPLDEKLFVKKAISALAQEKKQRSLRSLMVVLFYSGTEQGLEALRKVTKEPGILYEDKDFAKKLLQSNKMSTRSLMLSSYPSIKKKRKKALRRISDEALIEFDQYTYALILKRNSKLKIEVGPVQLELMDPVNLIIGSVFFLLFGGYSIYLIKFLKYFKNNHKTQWDNLWNQSIPFNYLFANHCILHRHLIKKEFMEIADSKLHDYGSALRRFTIILICYFVGFIIYHWGLYIL